MRNGNGKTCVSAAKLTANTVISYGLSRHSSGRKLEIEQASRPVLFVLENPEQPLNLYGISRLLFVTLQWSTRQCLPLPNHLRPMKIDSMWIASSIEEVIVKARDEMRRVRHRSHCLTKPIKAGCLDFESAIRPP
jgi:hypothetical protein